jgi:cell migration-inducing and hyaluronan-binding protein
MGFTHASGLGGGDPFTSRVVDSLFVGETENVGNPGTPEEIAYGRSLPKPSMPDFPIRGYEYYDLRHDVVNTTFVNYEDNDTRKTGAMSYLMFTSFAVTTNNTVEAVEFVNAKPVYFPPMEPRWGSDNGSSVAWKTAVIRDKDGSIGGIPDSYVLLNDGVNDSIAADTQACEIKPAWNAAVCRGDVGRLSVGAAGGAGGRGGFGGFGGGRGGAAPAAAAGRGFGFGGGGAAAEPVTLSRNGKDYELTATDIRAGTEIEVTTERPDLSLTLTELDAGSWVIFDLPGFTTAASGMEQGSLDALREASDTSYYKGSDALWVKIVSNGGPNRARTSLDVSR